MRFVGSLPDLIRVESIAKAYREINEMIMYKADHSIKWMSQDMTMRSIRDVLSLVKVESSLF